jgi:hypothetical protein
VFQENARLAGIYGDAVGLATQDEQARPRIEFVSAYIADPKFSGRDVSQLDFLRLAWREETENGREAVHEEHFTPEGHSVIIDGKEQPELRQTWEDGRIRAAWIRNKGVKGFPFGFSDLDGGVAELVEEYDHTAGKRTRTIDYFAEPNLKAWGLRPGDIKKDKTIFFLPKPRAENDLELMEWGGSQPDVETHQRRIQGDLWIMSGVPPIAYGGIDQAMGALSGVALRILFGPLLAKCASKWAGWGPALEYLMWLCLRAEGFDVALEEVDALWVDPLPVDELQKAQEEKAAVEAGLRSLETAISRMGAEDPRKELRQIRKEGFFLARAGAGYKGGMLTRKEGFFLERAGAGYQGGMLTRNEGRQMNLLPEVEMLPQPDDFADAAEQDAAGAPAPENGLPQGTPGAAIPGQAPAVNAE